jgi:ankyrin repeat protein
MKFENLLTEYSTHGLNIHDIERFLEEGGSIDYQSDNGKTLLHYAADGNDFKAAQFLIGKKANLNLQDGRGDTPLHLAVDSDIDYAVQYELPLKIPTVVELINAGADEKLKDIDGRTPRDIAACYGKYAMDFYDSVSRISSANEPSLTEFSERCIEIVNTSGYNAKSHDEMQISIAESPSGHEMAWHHFYILSGELYYQRHNIDFPEKLVIRVREGFESLKKRRNA